MIALGVTATTAAVGDGQCSIFRPRYAAAGNNDGTN